LRLNRYLKNKLSVAVFYLRLSDAIPLLDRCEVAAAAAAADALWAKNTEINDCLLRTSFTGDHPSVCRSKTRPHRNKHKATSVSGHASGWKPLGLIIDEAVRMTALNGKKYLPMTTKR
jgi:hypothetical protein